MSEWICLLFFFFREKEKERDKQLIGGEGVVIGVSSSEDSLAMILVLKKTAAETPSVLLTDFFPLGAIQRLGADQGKHDTQ